MFHVEKTENQKLHTMIKSLSWPKQKVVLTVIMTTCRPCLYR